MPRHPTKIVSSEHLVSETSAELSELEYALIMAGNAFNRWMVRCMAAAGAKDMTAVEVSLLHHVSHRDRKKKLADICFVLNIEDTHVATYALKKLVARGYVKSEKTGKEVFFDATDAGRALCLKYRDVRERCLIETLKDSGLTNEQIGDAAQLLRHASGFGDDPVERQIVRFARQLAHAARVVRDADRRRRRRARPRGERAVVIAAAVAEPEAAVIEADARNQQQVRHEPRARRGLGDPVAALAHRRIGRPRVEFERRARRSDHGQRGLPARVAREPGRDRVARVELARQRPVEADRARRALRENREHALCERLVRERRAMRVEAALRKRFAQRLLRVRRLGACYAFAH